MEHVRKLGTYNAITVHNSCQISDIPMGWLAKEGYLSSKGLAGRLVKRSALVSSLCNVLYMFRATIHTNQRETARALIEFKNRNLPLNGSVD